MRLWTFDEDPVIEYTCCTARISRNHESSARLSVCTRVFSGFETRKRERERQHRSRRGWSCPSRPVKTLRNPADRADPLHGHVGGRDKPRASRNSWGLIKSGLSRAEYLDPRITCMGPRADRLNNIGVTSSHAAVILRPERSDNSITVHEILPGNE